MNRSDKIAVIGAGLVGSALAIFLARQGFRVDLYEKRADTRIFQDKGNRSIDLALSFRGWKGLGLIGVGEDLRKYTLPMYGRMIHGTDQSVIYQQYAASNDALYSVSRNLLNNYLLDIVTRQENLQIRFNHECASLLPELRGGTLKNTLTGDIVNFEADVVIGADGIFSKVRDVIDSLKVSSTELEYMSQGYKQVTIPPGKSGNWILNPTALHIWPRGKFMMIALPNIDKSFTCTLILPLEGENSFAAITNARELELLFLKYFPDALRVMPGLAEEYFERRDFKLISIQSENWYYKNRMMVIGDAAHGILPFYGQGLNAGLEDCAIFGQLMSECNNWETVFERFWNARKSDADAIAELSKVNFIEMREKTGDPKFLLRKKIDNRIRIACPEDWVSVYNMVSFSDDSYQEALRIWKKQELIIDRIMNIENIENVWQEINYSLIIKS